VIQGPIVSAKPAPALIRSKVQNAQFVDLVKFGVGYLR
jgi:hypothetical protein